MTQEHPIRPPHELVQQWVSLACENEGYETWQDLATQAARWGADMELEACCEWLVNEGHEYEHVALRDDRRPKPSLKKQALETLCSMQIDPCWINGINTNADLMSKYDIIRRALEQLND
jgi:hypothetical protein